MANTDIDAILAERQRDLMTSQRRPVLLRGSFDNTAAQPDGGPGFFGTVGDVLAAPFRGVEGALQDAYGLVDTLTADALPDWEARLLGESQTGVGGMVEGISNFAAGFIPVAGWLGKSGKIGRTLNLTKGAEKAAKAAGATKKAAGINIARGAVAGAITDFTVFDGHEERLSNLLESSPALSNPVTALLAADEDDPELVGRLKAVVEGLGIGAAADGLLVGLKALRAGRKAKAAGASDEAIDKAMLEATSAEEHKDAFNRMFETPEERTAREALDAADGVTDDPLAAANRSPVEKAAEELNASVEPPPKLETPEAQQALKAAEELDAARAAGSAAEDVPDILRQFTDDDTVMEIVDELDRREVFGLDPSGNPRKMSTAELLEQRMASGDLNLSDYKATAGAKNTLRAVESLFRKVMEEDVDVVGKKTLDQLDTETFEALTDLTGARNRQVFMAQLQRDVSDAAGLSARIRAYKAVTVSMGEDLKRKIDVALSTDPQVNTNVAALEARKAAQEYAEVVAATKGLVSEQGRGLRAFQMDTHQIPDFEFDPDALDTALQEAGGVDKLRAELKKVQAAYGDGGTEGLSGMARAAEVSRLGRGGRMLNEYWINSILSGAKTFAVNGLGGILTSVYRPLELMVGGALTGNQQAISDAARELSSMLSVIPESFKLAKDSWMLQDNILSPRSSVFDIAATRRNAITSANAGLEAESFMGRAVDFLGNTVRIPSRVLTSTDEFIKQVNYRARVKSDLMSDGLRQGLRGEELAEHVTDTMAKIVGDGQAYSHARLFREGLDEAAARGITGKTDAMQFATVWARENFDESFSALSKRATAQAEEVTFTAPLRPGSASASFQNFVNAVPVMRFVTPFVRTPTNILTFTAQRFDAPSVLRAGAAKLRGKGLPTVGETNSRLLLDLSSNDPRKASEAAGRVAAGIGFIAVGMQAAQNGVITGKGPADPEQRSILEANGWQPYSIKTPNGYVSYQRMDPLASMIGLVADVSDYFRFADQSEAENTESIGHALMVSAASNITNKSYLAGVRNWVQAMSEPERFMPKLAQRYAASGVPSLVGQSVGAFDETEREIRSVLDAVRSRIPGLSDSLEPVRNILGEPVSRVRSLGAEGTAGVADMVLPLAYTEVGDDLIAQEMAQLRHGFSPPRPVKGGIDLLAYRDRNGRSAYDRWAELHGQVTIEGQSLRQALTRTIRSGVYQRATAESTPTVESPRRAMLSSVIQSYRRKAYEQVLREYPELMQADRSTARQRRLAAMGLSTQ